MKKTLLATSLLTLAFLTGCGPNIVKTSVYQDALLNNKDLKDCTAHYVGDGWDSITVIRCPLSTTTTVESDGKNTKTNIVIDGVTYEPKQN